MDVRRPADSVTSREAPDWKRGRLGPPVLGAAFRTQPAVTRWIQGLEGDVDVINEDFREKPGLALIDFVPAFCDTSVELAEQMLRRDWRMQFISAHSNRPGEPAVLGDWHAKRLAIAEPPRTCPARRSASASATGLPPGSVARSPGSS